jgi:hypothetical protein
MNGEADWGNPLYIIVNAIALFLVPLTITYIAARMGKVPLRRLLDRHCELAVSGLLLFVAWLVYSSTGPSWAPILMVGVAVILLLVRYEYTVTKFSGQTGGFSGNRDGPYDDPMECEPLHPAWKPIEGAKWIWKKKKPSDQEAQRGQTVWHRLDFWLLRSSHGLASATLTLMADDWVNVYVNGQLVAENIRSSQVPTTVYFAPFLRRWNNVIHMEITNDPGREGATGEENPAGIVYALRVA